MLDRKTIGEERMTQPTPTINKRTHNTNCREEEETPTSTKGFNKISQKLLHALGTNPFI